MPWHLTAKSLFFLLVTFLQTNLLHNHTYWNFKLVCWSREWMMQWTLFHNIGYLNTAPNQHVFCRNVQMSLSEAFICCFDKGVSTLIQKARFFCTGGVHSYFSSHFHRCYLNSELFIKILTSLLILLTCDGKQVKC